MNQLHVSLNLSSKAWNAPLVTAEAEALVREAPDELAQAHLLASHRKKSGEWLHMAGYWSPNGQGSASSSSGAPPSDCSVQTHKCHQCGTEVDHCTVCTALVAGGVRVGTQDMQQ